MNDIEFENIATQAARSVREEAERIADSRGALAVLLADRAGDATPPPDRLVDLSTDAPHHRRPWFPILVAAATIVAVSGLVLLANRDTDDLTPSTEPPVVRVTTPVVVEPPTDAATPDTDPAESDTTSATTTLDTVIAVPDLIGPTLERTVAMSTVVRTDQAQLGWEDCQECEALRPWAPIISPDGTVYVADAVNNRWVWQAGNGPITTPFAPGEVVVAAPVLDADGLIYAAVATSITDRADLRILVFDPATMKPFDDSEFTVNDTGHDRLEIVNGVLFFGDQQITEFQHALGDPMIDIEGQIITVALSGIQRRFELPDGWSVDRGDAAPVGDGSVVLRAFVPGRDETATVLLRLWLDGTTASGVVSGRNATMNSAVQLGGVGMVQLERTDDVVDVARYALPEFVGPDPLAGWTVPAFDAPSLDAVPRLLPLQPVPGIVSSARREYADKPSARTSYGQTWVRAGSDGAVEGVVQITTNFDPSPVQPSQPSDQITVAGWQVGYFPRTSPAEIVTLQLHSATRSMSVWTSGLDRATVTELSGSLTVDGDGAGWTSPAMADADGWVLVNEGWTVGAASRTLIQESQDGSVYVELWITSGINDAIATPGFLDSAISLIDIGGRPALAFDQGPDRSAVTWSPEDGVVVVLGSRGPLDVLIETAQSVTGVDAATWEAASVVDESGGDGCNSMFC